MYADGPNPTRVQPLPRHRGRGAPAPPPLVLIHDGGGTTFSYFILGSLCREVWAIHNPRYFDGEPWAGGMDEMARHYVRLMVDAGIRGTIVLGGDAAGWSLGGLLSLVVARLLAGDARATISVAGLLLIDSPYHVARSHLPVPTSKPRLDGIPPLVQRSFDNCDAMLQHWDLPPWDGPACRGEPAQCRVPGTSFVLAPGSVLYRPVDGAWRQIGTRSHGQERVGAGAGAEPGAGGAGVGAGAGPDAKPVTPPPGVLIRCTRLAATVDGSRDPCVVDMNRAERLLGWEGNHADFIKAVIDLDADHYNMFDKYDDAKMKGVTARLNEGLEILDSLHVVSGQAK